AWRWRHRQKGNSVASGSVLRPESEWLPLPKETTPAIVSPELWQAAQTRLASNRGETTRNETRAYLLRGLNDCAICLRSMWPFPVGAGRARNQARRAGAGPITAVDCRPGAPASRARSDCGAPGSAERLLRAGRR